ncbi:MAG: hypothetical protein AB1439_01620 [candidate division FCPU426 bacterium]
MSKYLWLPLLLVLGTMTGCSSMNVSLGGELGGASLGANVDPLNKNVNVNAGKTIKTGGVETTVNTSTDGSGVGMDTDVQYDPDAEE